LIVSQDVGEPTSSKRDKSRFQLDALVTFSVPVQRRKAFGKVRALRAKLSQLAAKNQFAADKIVAEVNLARTALIASRQRVAKATESFELAQQMRAAEQQLFDQGQSTLFNLNIREQQAAESAAERVQAVLEYFLAKADYAAAMGYENSSM
jgi:outer membrane protein TolC